MAESARTVVRIGDRELSLSNLDKPLYPDGFTKGQVIDYYTRIAPVILAHLQGRNLTMVRFPNGVEGQSFFAKNVPAGAPAWVDRVALKDNTYPVLDDVASLVWAANLAGIELHVPLHRAADESFTPDRIVFDLDPGPGCGVCECAEVAVLIHSIIEPLGLAMVAKTSGSKGMQLYVKPIEGTTYDGDGGTTAFAKAVAEGLERTHPDRVVSKQAKELRPGKILIDWSQNVRAKTTVCAYSLRARPEPTVSTPLTWAEVETCAGGTEMRFTAPDVLDRVERLGDLFAW